MKWSEIEKRFESMRVSGLIVMSNHGNLKDKVQCRIISEKVLDDFKNFIKEAIHNDEEATWKMNCRKQKKNF